MSRLGEASHVPSEDSEIPRRRRKATTGAVAPRPVARRAVAGVKGPRDDTDSMLTGRCLGLEPLVDDIG
jgi:hypothetical protein